MSKFQELIEAQWALIQELHLRNGVTLGPTLNVFGIQFFYILIRSCH